MKRGTSLLLSVFIVGSATNVGDVVDGTHQVIGSLQDEGKQAMARFSNTSKIDEVLDTVGRQQQADFDVKLYVARQKAYSEFAQRASQKANQSLSEKNSTISEEKLDEAEVALKNMSRVGDELDAMENNLHDKLQSALGAKLDPELKAADKFAENASHLQSQAHSLMNPLYSLGDAAEKKADGLNDETNDALSSVELVVRKYRRHVTDHARSVQRSVERNLFGGQDRTATWRKVHRLVRKASWHVYMQEYLSREGLLSLHYIGGLSLGMVIAGVAAAISASVVLLHFKFAYARKVRTPPNDLYQYLA
jgi:hypothetical protein